MLLSINLQFSFEGMFGNDMVTVKYRRVRRIPQSPQRKVFNFYWNFIIIQPF